MATVTTERRWPGMSSAYASLPPHDSESVTGPGQVGVAFSAHRDVRYDVGGRSGTASYPGGSVVVSGADPIRWSHIRQPTEALEVYPDPALLHVLSEGRVAGSESLDVRPRIGVPDPVVLGVASALRRAHVTGAGPTDLDASHLATLLGAHLLRRYAGLSVADGGRRPRLDARAVHAVHDLVDADLGGPLTLQRLSAVAHLSPYHFARAFTATTGLPPHRYVTARRMDRARLLLTRTDRPVREVAADVGFTNLSHFRRVFRAHTGVLPGELRDAAGGRSGPESG